MKYMDTLNKRNTNWRQTEAAVALLTTVVLSACSSSTSDNKGAGVETQFPSTDSGPANMIVTGFNDTNKDATSGWLVNARMFRLNSDLADTGDATIDLVKYNDDFRVSRHVEFYTDELDTCEINDPDAPSTDTGNGGGDGNVPPTVSGGLAVVINTPSGPWFTLTRTIQDGQSIYTADNELPGELLPAGATLSIPGDVFPTVAAHPLFEPVAPDRLLPDEDLPVTADSAYSWIPTDDKNYMRITLQAYNADNEFVGFVVNCDVEDDGSFTMPADVINFISTTPYRLQARYARTYNRLDFVNGIVIRQRSRIAE